MIYSTVLRDAFPQVQKQKFYISTKRARINLGSSNNAWNI